jgi:hypothetical protein
MSLKRWLPLLGVLGLMVMVAGVAGAANNKSKTYDDMNPALDVMLRGLAPGNGR